MKKNNLKAINYELQFILPVAINDKLLYVYIFLENNPSKRSK